MKGVGWEWEVGDMRVVMGVDVGVLRTRYKGRGGVAMGLWGTCYALG